MIRTNHSQRERGVLRNKSQLTCLIITRVLWVSEFIKESSSSFRTRDVIKKVLNFKNVLPLFFTEKVKLEMPDDFGKGFLSAELLNSNEQLELYCLAAKNDQFLRLQLRKQRQHDLSGSNSSTSFGFINCFSKRNFAAIRSLQACLRLRVASTLIKLNRRPINGVAGRMRNKLLLSH